MTVRLIAGLALAALTAAPASAAALASYDNGWYNHNGLHSGGNTSTFTGYTFTSIATAAEHRAFFAFDLAGSSAASAISVTFFSRGTLLTDTGTETVNLYDYTGSVTDLVAGAANYVVGLPRFNDLGDGLIGSHTINAPTGSSMPEFTVQLDQSFVDQFNAALLGEQKIAFGAGLATGAFFTTQGLWGSSSGIEAARLNITELTASVPEPSSLLLAGLGILGLGLSRRSRQLARRPAAV